LSSHTGDLFLFICFSVVMIYQTKKRTA
jgi:hypothetical protein